MREGGGWGGQRRVGVESSEVSPPAAGLALLSGFAASATGQIKRVIHEFAEHVQENRIREGTHMTAW